MKRALLGDYGRIASWATHLDPDVLPDCKHCFLKRLEAILQDCYSHTSIPMCQHCCQWNLLSESQARTQVSVPNDYPTSCCINSPEVPLGREVGVKYLILDLQSFQWLILAVNVAAHNISAGFWNKRVMIAYL